MAKSEIIRLRCTSHQKAQLKTNAERAKLSLSEYLISSGLKSAGYDGATRRGGAEDGPESDLRKPPHRPTKLAELQISPVPGGKKTYQPDLK